ncbi:uncharacterized protein LOC116613976 [Nematostella vectensis]|uniref:uncharacterized protein LOC116613976 n=1 Tax=Nematostella vectensis TaxID=45351 RepID=UPI0013900E7E|nr:uncharacterized protein LOC116613976 [Nematostella vectensis]
MASRTPSCPCQDTKLVKYFYDDECLGFVCLSCWKEWLLERYVNATRDPPVVYNKKTYLSPVKSQLEEPGILQCTASREEIVPKNVAESVKRGDHITWQRPYLIWHHAIVEDVKDKMLEVIHYWKGDNGNIVFKRNTVDATQEKGTLYLITYNAQVRQYNPAQLVIARARALLGIRGYEILTNNCENLATFCKSGIHTNQQKSWFNNKLKEISTSIMQNLLTTMFKVSLAEILELGAEEMKYVPKSSEVIGAAEMIGAGVIIASEVGICIWNLNKLYQKYVEVAKDGRKSLSKKDFIKEVVGQISQRFFAGGLGAGGGIALTAIGTVLCPGLGTVGGAVLGIVGGCVGSLLGHVIGTTLGPFLSKAIVKTIMTNDRAVTPNDLRPGDHIVRYGNPLHPRCHAIVIRVYADKKLVRIVRHSYEKGVIQEVLPFEQLNPLFRVTYPANAKTYSTEDVVYRALYAVAEYDPKNPSYNIFFNNCKDFVYRITVKP